MMKQAAAKALRRAARQSSLFRQYGRPEQNIVSTNKHRLGRMLSTEIRAQTAAVAAANAAIAAEKKTAASGSGTQKKAESNVFLDNLGKIFLMGIATVIGTLVRSSYNTSNRNVIRDRIEDTAAMDPKELEDFREANSELTLDVMRKLLAIYYQDYAPSKMPSLDNINSRSSPSCTYQDFVFTIRKIMATKFPEYGESFTIQMGHVLDRIAIDVLEQRRKQQGETSSKADVQEELPVTLFWTALVSAMNGSVSDRIRILHELLQIEEELMNQSQKSLSSGVNLVRVRDLVGYLQETCQLPPDTQIVPTDQKYPTQQWRRATPDDLVPIGLQLESNDSSKGEEDPIDLVEFAAILRTKSVCAWGECYMRIKPDASEFEGSRA